MVTNHCDGSQAEERRRQTKFRRYGLATQLAMCVLNGLIMIFSIITIMFGIMIGLHSNTLGIGIDFDIEDWFATTPATIFIIYGFFLLILTLGGSFASVSGNYICVIVYVVFIVIFIIYDSAVGLGVIHRSDFYVSYLNEMVHYEDDYGSKRGKSHGLLPFLSPGPVKFWDNMQSHGQCCGIWTFKEWRNTSYSNITKSIPDSCCNRRYRYLGCGDFFWENLQTDWDNSVAYINKDGCIYTFPEIIYGDTHAIDSIGKVILAFLILLFVLGVVLIVLVARKTFRPSHGLANPGFMNVPDQVYCKCRKGRTFRRVAPDDSFDDSPAESRNVSFDETGPSFIDPYS